MRRDRARRPAGAGRGGKQETGGRLADQPRQRGTSQHAAQRMPDDNVLLYLDPARNEPLQPADAVFQPLEGHRIAKQVRTDARSLQTGCQYRHGKRRASHAMD